MNVSETDLKAACILIVDDQMANVLLLQRLLERDGYTNLYSTTNPLEVEGLYQQHHFDLILLDINMPKLDGFGVMAQLKLIEPEQARYPAIIVLTALIDLETRLRALKEGAKDFVTKPFERIEVLSRIHNLLEVRCLYHLVRQQNEELEQKVHERTLQLEEKTQELQETRLEVIKRLGLASEYRDNETGLHIIRMSQYAQLIGKAAGMSDDEAELLLNACPMHDVGKLGIPDSVLLKPGKLDAEEWTIMQTHVTIGADILSGHRSDLMEMAHLIALTHHEKWDGSGYPNGLKGEDIPLVGRIAALADVFDALTSERPYKKAWSVEDALSELDNNSGQHFDPQLLKHFKTILPQVLEIKEKFAEPS
jgi:putative two-component system response regulator